MNTYRRSLVGEAVSGSSWVRLRQVRQSETHDIRNPASAVHLRLPVSGVLEPRCTWLSRIIKQAHIRGPAKYWHEYCAAPSTPEVL